MDARLRPADDRQKHRRSQTDQTALDRNIDAQSLTEAVDFENRNQALMVFSGEFFKLIQAFAKQPEKR